MGTIVITIQSQEDGIREHKLLAVMAILTSLGQRNNHWESSKQAVLQHAPQFADHRDEDGSLIVS